MTKTRISILAAVIASNFLASFAFGVDGSAPWNPYCDVPKGPKGPNPQSRPLGPARRAPGTPEAVQRYIRNRQQYPNGPYGKRIVEVSISPRQLNPAQCRPLMQLDYQIAATTTHIRSLDAYIHQYTQRIWLIARYKNASREHYNAWRNLANTINMLHAQRNSAAGALRNLKASKYHMAARFSTRRSTRIIVNVHNHLKRSYIPTSHILQQARQHVLDNPELIGTTVHINR